MRSRASSGCAGCRRAPECRRSRRGLRPCRRARVAPRRQRGAARPRLSRGVRDLESRNGRRRLPHRHRKDVGLPLRQPPRASLGAACRDRRRDRRAPDGDPSAIGLARRGSMESARRPCSEPRSTASAAWPCSRRLRRNSKRERSMSANSRRGSRSSSTASAGGRWSGISRISKLPSMPVSTSGAASGCSTRSSPQCRRAT